MIVDGISIKIFTNIKVIILQFIYITIYWNNVMDILSVVI